MTKKRQQDFGKVQLRPGRPLGRRRNITATSFKAKKISMPKKEMKLKSDITILDCLKKIKGGGSEKDKTANLNELVKLIRIQSDSLSLHLFEIFDTVHSYLMESFDGWRNAALKVFTTIFEATDDLQIYSSLPLLTRVINSFMTNPTHKVRLSSLSFLDSLLSTHPDLICHNMAILNNLLKMVTFVPNLRNSLTTHATSEKECRFSQVYPINVLGYVNNFLMVMLKNKTFPQVDRDEQEVYWNSEKPLYLAIYAGSGLQPVDIEKSSTDNFDHQNAYFDESGSIEQFIDAIVNLIHGLFIGIIGGETKADDNTHRRDTIADLSILFQLLSNAAEWATLISYDGADDEIKKFLKADIVNRRRFPFELHSSIVGGGSLQPLVLLNLSICHLIAKYLQCDSDEHNNNIIEYVRKVFSREKSIDMKYNWIPVLAKIMKVYFKSTDIPEICDLLYTTVDLLAVMLKHHCDHPSRKILISLFVKMSLDSAYSFLIGSNGMKKWFSWLLKELKDNTDKIDKKLLGVIKKIANRKYPSFLEYLEFNAIKPLLKHQNRDIRETAIFLLYNMNLEERLLENISKVIFLDHYLPKQDAVRLIRLLTCRFSEESVNEKSFVDFTLFLLNVAVDTYNLNNEKMIDFEANPCSKALEPLNDCCNTFIILPSLHWKEHSALFDVCCKSLGQLPRKHVSVVMMEMFKEILKNTSSLPVHCAIAILRLYIPEIKDKLFRYCMIDLTFSCLLTVSVLIHASVDDEWLRWNVDELMNSIHFTKKTAYQILEYINCNRYGQPNGNEGLYVYHILRVIKFFIERHLLDPESDRNAENILEILKALAEENCIDKTLAHQPLYLQLYDFFYNRC